MLVCCFTKAVLPLPEKLERGIRAQFNVVCRYMVGSNAGIVK